MDLYNSYNRYLKKAFGTRVRKVMVDAGFSCPNIDGKIDTKGCIFCNNSAFSGYYADSGISIEQQIEHQLNKDKSQDVQYLAYFQPYTNTYGEPEKLYDIYSRIKPYNQIKGMIIGTRPDEIDDKKLSMIKGFIDEGYYVSIELGVQTFKDETLLFINRGHLSDSIFNAAEMIKRYNIDLGAHIILGFPAEEEADNIDTARLISKAGFNIVKIHHLQVFSNTRLYSLYQHGIVGVMTMEDYLNRLITFLEHLSPDIVISRLYAEARDDMLIAPRWNISKDEFLRLLNLEFAKRKTYQGKYYKRFNKDCLVNKIAI